MQIALKPGITAPTSVEQMKAMEKRAIERVVKQRMALVLRQPFFGSLALRLKLVTAWWMPTAGVDGKHLFINPSYVESMNDTLLKGLICHEVLHCANGHPWRRNGRDPELFNWACDYAIDPIIVASGMEVPDATVDAKYKGLSAEQIYAAMRDEAAQQKQQQQNQPTTNPGQGQPQPGQGNEASDGADDGQGQPQPGNGKPGKSSQQPGKDGPQAASATPDDGQGQPQDAPAQDARAPKHKATKGEVMDAPAETAHEDEANWKVAVIQAIESAKAQGKLPAGVDRLVDEFVVPKVDWRAVLRRFVQQCAALDYTWRLPSPRYMASGLYLPRLQSEQMPPIVIGVDTSGSIGHEELAAFTAEISAIIDEVKPEMSYVVYCDADIPKDGVQEFLPGDPLIYKPAGGGGTSFKPVFEWVEEQGLDPACLVYLTDMYGAFPDQAPAYPTLWASSTKDVPERYTAPFGETIYIGA